MACTDCWPLTMVISGGQTGADEAGLRAAKVLGYKTGGMMPRGWKTEAGPRPEFKDQYSMVESRFDGYEHRTRQNVRAATGTVIFARCGSQGLILETGSSLTEAVAAQLRLPRLVIDLDWHGHPAPAGLRQWIREHHIKVLNVAGNRESKAPGIGAAVEAYLLIALVPF